MITGKVRAAIIERDKKCKLCGSTQNPTVDHIIPLTRGGTNEFVNLQLLCRDCNQRKGPKILWGWWERIQMALHVDDNLANMRNEMLSGDASTRANFQNLLNQKITENNTQLRREMIGKDHLIEKQNDAIVQLHSRIRHLEDFLEVEFHSEDIVIPAIPEIPAQVTKIREYRKKPKLASQPKVKVTTKRKGRTTV